MKLNLLPTYVSKEGQAKFAVVGAALLALLSIGAAAGMIVYSNQKLDAAKKRATAWKPLYDQAVATSKLADDTMAKSVGIDRNLRLAKAMREHNTVYPDLYREVLRYVPSYFRVTSMAAAPAGESSTVTLTGVLKTNQQYVDVVLALLRIPGATNVTRANYTIDRYNVPGLNEGDQRGTAVKNNDSNLPSEPMARMEELIARANRDHQDGYLGVGGFGLEGGQKGAMPGWSEVTLTVSINKNIQTPNPRATLAAQGAAGAGAGPTAGSGGFGGPRGGGGAATGPGTPKGGAPATPRDPDDE